MSSVKGPRCPVLCPHTYVEVVVVVMYILFHATHIANANCGHRHSATRARSAVWSLFLSDIRHRGQHVGWGTGNAVGTGSWSACVYQTDPLDGSYSDWQAMMWVLVLRSTPLQFQVATFELRKTLCSCRVCVGLLGAGFRSHSASLDGGGGAVCQTLWAAIPRVQSSLRVLIRVGDRAAYMVQCKQVLPHDTVGPAAKALGRCAHT